MFARLNFLFAVSILTLLLFYLAGRFVIVKVLAVLAAPLVPYFIAAYVLVALMLTVLVLARTVIRLEPTTTQARRHSGGWRFVAAHTTLCLAHLCLLLAVYLTFAAGAAGAAWWLWLLATAVYIGGIAAAVADWRGRILPLQA